MKKFKNQKGLTLIEILVVIGVLAVLGFVMTDLLSRTLLGGNKTQLVDNIKQNGDKALSTLSDAIKLSDQVVCVDTYNTPQYSDDSTLTSFSGDTITIVSKGIFTRYSFIPPTSSANGYITEDNPTLDILATLNLDTTKTWVFCTSAIPLTNPQILTDQDTTSGTSVKSVSFIWTRNPGFKDVVSVSFNLSPTLNAGTGFQNTLGNSNQQNFSTTVELR